MKRILLLTTCLLGGLVAADFISLPTDPVQKNTLSSGVTDSPRFSSSDAPLKWCKESVGKQVDAWKEIHAAKRKIPGFSNTETNFPQLLGRIAYMAGYVREAIAGLEDREAAVDSLMQEAESLCKQGKLTFSEAAPLFFGLARACDRTVRLDDDTKFHFISSTLTKWTDCSFLCVHKGGLSISRIVDGYLHPIPSVYVCLPNQKLETGPHGNHHNNILSFFTHDAGHTGGHATKLWGELISECRSTFSLGSQGRKLIDVLLFQAFHERGFCLQNVDQSSFCNFITGMGGIAQNSFDVNFNRPHHIHGDDSTQESLEVFLKAKRVITDTDRIRFFYLETSSNSLKFNLKSDDTYKPKELSCTITPIEVTKVAVGLSIDDEIFSFQLDVFQWDIDDNYADMLYLLRYCGVKDLPERVTVANIDAVIKDFNHIIDEATKLLIGAAKNASDSVRPYVSPSQSTDFSSFGRTDRKDRKDNGSR